KMHREGNFSIHVKRPKSSILLARVDVAGIKRERLFTSGHGTEEGWINFAPHSHLPTTDTLDICLEVLHCAVVSKPTSEGSHITWDLRETLGRMPYAMGVPFVEEVRATSDEGTAIHLMVTFFPGGHTSAPRDHVSLWVSPLRGLEDRRYACIVDGSQEQRGSGESILHFPRVEVFGEIGIVICRSPSPDAPRRLRRFSDREYPGREPEAA
ncbi:HERC1, partial [Symbiodinium necroappetens]